MELQRSIQRQQLNVINNTAIRHTDITRFPKVQNAGKRLHENVKKKASCTRWIKGERKKKNERDWGRQNNRIKKN